MTFKNVENFLLTENIYCGANAAAKFIKERELTGDQIIFIRLRCLDFYIESCQQIVSRLPLENNPPQNFSFLGLTVVKAGHLPSILAVATLSPNVINLDQLQPIDTERLLLKKTSKIYPFSEKVVQFWKQVNYIKVGRGEIMFSLFTNFVFNIISLPH